MDDKVKNHGIEREIDERSDKGTCNGYEARCTVEIYTNFELCYDAISTFSWRLREHGEINFISYHIKRCV